MPLVSEYPKGKEIKLSDEFDSTDFDCQCNRSSCTVTLVAPELVEGLDKLALIYPILTINRGYSCPEHNQIVGGVKNSYHILGKAVDITSPFGTPREMKVAAEKILVFANGGIGLYPNHLHLDTRGEKARW